METYENEITKTAGKLLYKVKKALLGEDVAKAIGMRKRPKAVKKVVKKFEEDVTKNLWRNAKGYAKKNKKKIIAGALGTAAVGGAAAGGTGALVAAALNKSKDNKRKFNKAIEMTSYDPDRKDLPYVK